VGSAGVVIWADAEVSVDPEVSPGPVSSDSSIEACS
jgi:hypothetical protein